MTSRAVPRLLPLALGCAVSCSALVTFAFWLKKPSGPMPEADALGWWLEAWSRWDGGWYMRIATEGYWYTPGQQSPVAFFPGYPLLLGLLAALGVPVKLAGVLLTWACGLGALAVFRRWAGRLAPAPSADLATALLVLYPFAFYLYGAVYSDALYLLIAASAFLLLERGQVGWASLLGLLATATRPIAPAMVVGLLWRSLERRRALGQPWRVVDFLPLLSGVGLLLYMAFLWQRFGDPLAFAHVQGAPGWDQAPGPRTWFKLTYLRAFEENPRLALRLSLHALVTAVGLLLCVPLARRVGWGYAAYVALALGIPAVSSKDFQGLGRYALAAFPCFLAAALLLAERPRLRVAVLAGSVLLLAVLSYLFGAGEYVS